MFYVPSVVAGFALGFICAIVLVYLRDVIRKALLTSIDSMHHIRHITRALRLPDHHILEIPSVGVYGDLTVHEGWMVVYYDDYDSETFDIENAQPAYVNLNGRTLRISYTRERVLRKAVWDELPYKRKFYHYEEFDIYNCDVKLLPEDLKRNKRWSRKYPIYLALRDSDHGTLGATLDYSTLVSVSEGEESNIDCGVDREKVNPKLKEVPTKETPLYLFARTSKQKEDWFRRLVVAARTINKEEKKSNTTITSQTPKIMRPKTGKNRDFIKYVYPVFLEPHPSNFLNLMSDYHLQVVTNAGICLLKPTISDHEHNDQKDKIEIAIEIARKAQVAPNLFWFNAFMARIVTDVVQNPKVKERLQKVAQKKVASIRLPSFVEDITVTDIFFGETVPRIHCTSNPMLDRNGLWVNADITYAGNAYLVLETRLNLMNKSNDDSTDDGIHDTKIETKKATYYLRPSGYPKKDSNISTLNDSQEAQPATSSTQTSHKKRKKVKNKFLRFMNTIVQSKAFQCATRHSCFKHTIEEWSNTKLMLIAELKGFAGTLTLNIPPPPGDRIWFGFHNCPYLNIKASPTMGTKSVDNFKNLIQNGLIKVFRKRLVLPNMSSIVIPAMNGSLPQ